MNEFLQKFFASLAIVIGIGALIKILGNAEYVIISLSLTFGILAIIWTVVAHKSLSHGSSLRSYTGYFLACLILILVYSVWNSAEKIFSITGAWRYLEYLFITLAYMVFVSAAYKIYHLGKEFGFQKEAEKIKKVMKEKR